MYFNTSIYIFIYISFDADVYLYIHVYTELYTYTYMWLYVHTCIYTYIWIYVSAWVSILICLYIHMHVYIYICMYTSFCPFCGIKSKSQTEKTTDTSNLGARTNDNMLCKRIRHGSKLYSASFPFPFPCKTSPFPPAFPLVHLLSVTAQMSQILTDHNAHTKLHMLQKRHTRCMQTFYLIKFKKIFYLPSLVL